MKMCPTCGSPEHPEWKAHVFVNTELKKAVANSMAGVVANKTSKHGVYRDVEKRRKYQKELMRERRKRGKVK